jgi:hypothetical protein
MPLVHDCDLDGNPSHTGLSDLLREYHVDLRRQMIVYHYASPEAGMELEKAGLRVAKPGDRLTLPSPRGSAASHAAAVRQRVQGDRRHPSS